MNIAWVCIGTAVMQLSSNKLFERGQPVKFVSSNRSSGQLALQLFRQTEPRTTTMQSLPNLHKCVR